MTNSSDAPLKHQYAEVNGVKLHYVSSGEGQLILFLHGFPEFWYTWKNQLAEFGKDHFAIAPDMRGYNLSDKPKGLDPYKQNILVEDIRAFIEHLGYKKLILVGHDWGGFVAWNFAIAYPDYLEKLIIINIPHPAIFERELISNPAQQKASRYINILQNRLAEKFVSAFRYQIMFRCVFREMTQKGLFTPEDKKAYIEAWSQPGALTASINYYRAAHVKPSASQPKRPISVSVNMFGDDPNLLQVKVPTLIIWGEKDRYLLEGNLKGVEQFVPDLTIKRIPDGSHWVIHEKPELVNSYIRQFIS